MKRELLRAMAVAAGMAGVGAMLAGPAAAGQGKPGLWDVTATMKMGGAAAMPDLSQMPPEVLARMKAMNIHPADGNAVRTQQCVTPAQAAESRPNMPANQDCKMVRSKTTGNTFTGDMACSGQFQGTGHVTVTYLSDTHYTGKMTIKGAGEGQPMEMNQTFEGKWVSPDCGAVAPH
jgi:hypothetical protein